MVTTGTKQNKVEPAGLSAREVELKKLLGNEEFIAYQEYQAGIQRKAKVAKAKEIATAMVTENGEYAVQYQKLETQLNAIWDKCLAEARVQVGLPAEEPTKEK